MGGEEFISAAKTFENILREKLVPVDDDTKLQLYGLYKQATIGDVNTDR